MRSAKRTAGLVVGLFIALGLIFPGALAAQEAPSATPARISIPTLTPIITDAALPTPTWTATPTPRGVVLLEALSEANVRSEPDINSERLGSIQAGDSYPVIGRSFRWLQFEYDTSTNGTGWVYDELVTIIGNPDDIVDLNANLLPTVDTGVINATQTWEAVITTPGGILTATADARIIQAPVGSGSSGVSTPGDNTPRDGALSVPDSPLLPTYTYPPGIVAQAPTDGPAGAQTPTPGPSGSAATTGGVAPIVPILALGGAGLLGLIFSSTRRS